MPDKGTAATAIYSDGKFIGYGAYNQYATILIDTHNADCDAYEKRIAELEAEVERRQQTLEGYYIDAITAKTELARVKAESLRVVPTKEHELGHWEVAMAVFIGGATTIYERYDSEDGKLVRLERWETEDGN